MSANFFRPLFTLFVFVFTLSACQTTQKFVDRGDYDGAIDFCIRKIEGKKNKKTEYVQGLELAFKKAQTRDLATVENLMAANRPEYWERINEIHCNIQYRQEHIMPLTPLRAKDGYTAHFDFVDIAKLENESRTRAAEYLYQEAQTLIVRAERGDRQAARNAYYKLTDLEKRYFRSYRDKDVLKKQARDLGTAKILFEMANSAPRILPAGFNERVMNISKYDLDSEWKSYYFKPEDGTQFDYKVVLNISNIDISPERVHERSYTDEKEIEDGWDYVLDSKGNVLKDSLGNDVKTPRFVRIRADVLEVFQSKATRLGARVEIYDAYKNTLLNSRDLSAEVLFENYASTFQGDRRALSAGSLNRIGNAPQPFPTDENMLMQAADRLKPNLRDELRGNNVIQ
ncbi:MAG: hypothetical protein WCR52_05970 [Bacteroidota bacterium]